MQNRMSEWKLALRLRLLNKLKSGNRSKPEPLVIRLSQSQPHQPYSKGLSCHESGSQTRAHCQIVAVAVSELLFLCTNPNRDPLPVKISLMLKILRAQASPASFVTRCLRIGEASNLIPSSTGSLYPRNPNSNPNHKLIKPTSTHSPNPSVVIHVSQGSSGRRASRSTRACAEGAGKEPSVSATTRKYSKIPRDCQGNLDLKNCPVRVTRRPSNPPSPSAVT